MDATWHQSTSRLVLSSLTLYPFFQQTLIKILPLSSVSPPSFSPHGYAVELYFDTALENQVLKAWNVLASCQISNHLISISSRSHITLFSSSSSLFLDPTAKLLPSSVPSPLNSTLSPSPQSTPFLLSTSFSLRPLPPPSSISTLSSAMRLGRKG